MKKTLILREFYIGVVKSAQCMRLAGKNTDDNIQLMRAKCNLQKNKKDPVQFMQERGFLL